MEVSQRLKPTAIDWDTKTILKPFLWPIFYLHLFEALRIESAIKKLFTHSLAHLFSFPLFCDVPVLCSSSHMWTGSFHAVLYILYLLHSTCSNGRFILPDHAPDQMISYSILMWRFLLAQLPDPCKLKLHILVLWIVTLVCLQHELHDSQ